MNFKQKYLKYKTKYTMLKNQICENCWRLRFDSNTGEPYYRNIETGLTIKDWSSRKIDPQTNMKYQHNYIFEYNSVGQHLIQSKQSKKYAPIPFALNAKDFWEIKTPEELGLNGIPINKIDGDKIPGTSSVKIDGDKIPGEELNDIPINKIDGDELNKFKNNIKLLPDGDINGILGSAGGKDKKHLIPNRFIVEKTNIKDFKIYPTLFKKDANDL